MVLPYIEWVNIQMLATDVTVNTEVFSFAGAASAANSSRSDGLFAAKAAPTFTVVQLKNNKISICRCASVANNYRINPLSLVKTQLNNIHR